MFELPAPPEGFEDARHIEYISYWLLNGMEYRITGPVGTRTEKGIGHLVVDAGGELHTLPDHNWTVVKMKNRKKEDAT